MDAALTPRWDQPIDADMEAYAHMLAHAFGSRPEQSARWIERLGRQNTRLVHEGSGLAAGLGFYDAGQFFGGEALPTLAVAGVAVRPESRRRGLARGMMARALREAAAAGLPLSSLYAANYGLYRSVGFELAGSSFQASLAPDRIREGARDGHLRALSAADMPARQALYRRVAAQRNGFLDRDATLWQRVSFDRDGQPLRAYGVFSAAGDLEGYATFHRTGGQDVHQVFQVEDLLSSTPEATTRLLSMFGDLSSVVGELRFPSAPADPFLMALPEPRVTLRLNETWVLRILDLPAALQGRGWPAAVQGRVELDLQDDLLPAHAGRWRLEVSEGQARVTRGGAGSVQLGPRGLATIYAGYASPRAAAAAGLLRGPDDQLALLGQLLAGPAPWMIDHF